MKKGRKVVWVGVVMLLLAGAFAYLVVLERAKVNLPWNVMVRTERMSAEMDGREPTDVDEMEERPAAWGAGSYDKLMRIRRTMGNEVEGTWSLAKVWDVEERLAEKICRTPILKRGTEEEVLADGFVGLMRETWAVILDFRPEHDLEPLWVIMAEVEEDEDFGKAREIVQSMSVVRPGE